VITDSPTKRQRTAVFFGMDGTPVKEVGIDALVANEYAKTCHVVVTNGAGHFNATNASRRRRGSKGSRTPNKWTWTRAAA
jgi:hypothetical protein